jgi:hypothetical protein
MNVDSATLFFSPLFVAGFARIQRPLFVAGFARIQRPLFVAGFARIQPLTQVRLSFCKLSYKEVAKVKSRSLIGAEQDGEFNHHRCLADSQSDPRLVGVH